MMLRMLALISLFAAVSTASAHPGHSHELAGTVPNGIAHPWMGIDHLLAMLVVGVMAMRCGPRGRWTLPVLFCGSMAIASLVGRAIGPVSGLEIGLALTLVAMGVCLVRRFHHAMFPVIATLCGGLHGFAHGVDIGAGVGSVQYLAGMMLGTAVIHLIGIGIGTALYPTPSRSPCVDPSTSNTVA
ncbi:HupE / UreJ protein [Stieleria neptunia]|uniref:HupE / UreJ protein n=1 Tax=Stieleria neptunia TaxID=2527979 RepID=A0A518HV13_9BACT|nr:HupE/UreJ family protein [Stieleria neptunia]QDV44692.1 HupE / UreJ protein [Stieleria neptunia]